MEFTLLFILNFLIHHYFREKNYSSPLAGSIVMAIGIFFFSPLPQIISNNDPIIKFCVLELLIIWLYIASSYFICYLQGNFTKYLFKDVNDRFSMGTWVAGSAVMAILLHNELPGLLILFWTISAIAAIIWLVYLYLIIESFFISKVPHTGLILLSTVSTQSIVILNQSLFIYIPEIFNWILIVIGCIFYLLGIKKIIYYHTITNLKHLIHEWPNSNSIIHGAVSITGLACLLSNTIPSNISIHLWITASCLLFPIEIMGLIKLKHRFRMKYDISQWSRLFTLGMYYALSTSLYNKKIVVNFLLFGINTVWPYLLLIILSIEIVLFLKDKFSYNDAI